MADQSYIGKFNIATTNTYANRIYSESADEGTPPAPTPPMQCYFLLQEDFSYLLLEDGVGKLELECTVEPLVCSFFLQEDGYYLLQEDGSHLELECGAIPMISFNLTLTGPWASSHTVTAQYQKNGNLTTLYIPAYSAAATSSSLITSTATIPALIVPSAGVGDPYQAGLPVINNSLSSDGAATIDHTTGILTIGLNIIGTGESILLNAFQNSGNAGFDNLVFTYLTV